MDAKERPSLKSAPELAFWFERMINLEKSTVGSRIQHDRYIQLPDRITPLLCVVAHPLITPLSSK
jgi:hypothetical protein